MQLKTYYIIPDLCLKCNRCPVLEVCPRNVVIKEEDEPAFVGPGCAGCGKCVEACRGRAVRQL